MATGSVEHDSPPPLGESGGTRSSRRLFRCFDDCDEVGEFYGSQAGVEFTQLNTGPFRGAITRLELGDLRVHHTVTSGRTFARTRFHDDYLYFSVPVSAQELAADGKTVSQLEVFQHPRADDLLRLGRDVEGVNVAVPKDRLLRDAAALAGMPDEPVLLETRSLDRSSLATRQFTDLVLDFAQHARRNASILSLVEHQEALRRQFEQAVLHLLVHQIGVRDEPPPPPGSRKKIVLHAEQVLEEAEGRPVSLAELCRAARVSERTLRYAFQELCGVSPQRYMQIQRLRAAHRALRQSDGSRGSVKVAAYQVGFRELGRFSVQYRQFFGESPSETLMRRVSPGPIGIEEHARASQAARAEGDSAAPVAE